MDILELMKREMFRRRLSPKTISTYLFYVRKFLLFCNKEPRRFSKSDCRQFLEKFMDKGVSGSTLNVVLNSLRFMMEEILRKRMRLNLRYSKTPKRIPVCLNRDEILRIISEIKNDKHRIIVCLMYGSGLRVSEVLNLRSRDIDIRSNIGWVRGGKGNKDRPFILPACLKEGIMNLMDEDSNYLFTSKKNRRFSIRSIQCVIKVAVKRVGIRKNVHPHTLRHSFATHLLEEGSDVTAVQSLLGHSEARTTLTYLHNAKPRLINIKSPLDRIYD